MLASPPPLPARISNFKEPIRLHPPSSTERKEMSSWREDLKLLGSEATTGLQLNSVLVPLTSRWTTNMVAHPEQPLIAISAATRNKNAFIVKYNTASKQQNEEMFTIHSAYTNAYPIFSMDWQNDHLLMGCAQNYVQLCQVDSISGKFSTKAQFPHPIRSDSNFAAPPGKFCYSNRVAHVQFSPAAKDSSNFIAVESYNLRLWNVNNNSVPFANCKVSQEQLMAADWSLQCPNMVSLAGVDGSIVVVDLRSMGYVTSMNANKPADDPIAWFKAYTHSSFVHSVKWSPFVPHWLASGSADHSIKVWDLRLTKMPVCEIDQDSHAIKSLTWSPTHGNLLASGSEDGIWHLWNIKADKTLPYYSTGERILGATPLATFGRSSSGSSIVSTVSAPLITNSYFVVSAAGELYSAKVTDDHMNTVTSHRYSEKLQPEHYELEKHVFRRDLKSALELVVEFCKETSEEGSKFVEDVNQMIELTQPMDAVTLKDFKSDHQSGISSTTSTPIITSNTTANNPSLYSSVSDPVDLISNIYFTIKYSQSNKQQDSTAFTQIKSQLSPLSDLVPVHMGILTELKSRVAQANVDDVVADDIDKLSRFSYFIPNGCNMNLLHKSVPHSLKMEYENLRLNIQTRSLLEEVRLGTLVDDPEAIDDPQLISQKLLALTPDILKCLGEDPLAFSPQLLFQILKHTMSTDYLRVLEFGLRIAEIYDKYDGKSMKDTLIKFQNISSIVHLLLFPTVFDRQDKWLQTPAEVETTPKKTTSSRFKEVVTRSALEEEGLAGEEADFVSIPHNRELMSILHQPKSMVAMLKLEYRIQRTLLKFSKRRDQNYLFAVSEAVLSEMGNSRSISIATTTAHLNALLLLGKFDEYFNIVLDMIQSHSGNQYFLSLLQKHVETIGNYRIQRNRDKVLHILDPLKSEWTFKELLSVHVFILLLTRLMVSSAKYTNLINNNTTLSKILDLIKSKMMSHLKSVCKAYELWMEAAHQSLSVNETISDDSHVDIQKLINRHQIVDDVKKLSQSIVDLIMFYNTKLGIASSPTGTHQPSISNVFSVQSILAEIDIFDQKLKQWINKKS